MLTPKELKKLISISEEEKAFVKQSRAVIQNILKGVDERLLLIIGPCSLQNKQADLEFADRLKELAHAVKDDFFVVMRAYFEKPRTSLGWKGLLMDPFVDGSNNIEKGFIQTRELLVELTKKNIPLATEFLSPITSYYFEELISWGCIGARTASSQIHREIASRLNMPVGFKNPTDGNSLIAIHSLMAASHPHTFFGFNEEGQAVIETSTGNAFVHLILRGGHHHINYDSLSVDSTLKMLKEADLPQRVLIDCSHDNAKKGQIPPFQSAIEQIIQGNRAIRGLLVESHINSGKQAIFHPLKYGVSITDTCLDFATTEKLVLSFKHQINSLLTCV